MRYTFLTEPRHNAYRELLRLSGAFCSEAILVRRDSLDVSARFEQVMTALRPFIVRIAETSEWPGTVLLTETATVSRFSLYAESIEILSSYADGLYSWRQPDLPEDLCLLRPDGQPFLVTIAHERDAYLDLAEEAESFLRAASMLRLQREEQR